MNSDTQSQPSHATPRGGSGAMFDKIAGRYDAVNRVLSLGLDKGWRKRAAKALGTEDVGGPRILDVATGTGDLALEILRRDPRARVVGLDPSKGMLSVLGTKAERRHAKIGNRLQFSIGTAEEIPHPNHSFDGVTIAFGLRNVADRELALGEMLRVLRPGRRLVILEFTNPDGGPLASIARFHIQHVVPKIGAVLSGAREYKYLRDSIDQFPSAPELVSQIREAGADRVWNTPMAMGAVHLFVATRGELGKPASE